MSVLCQQVQSGKENSLKLATKIVDLILFGKVKSKLFLENRKVEYGNVLRNCACLWGKNTLRPSSPTTL